MSADKHRKRDRLVKKLQEFLFSYSGEMRDCFIVNSSRGSVRLQPWMEEALEKGYLKRKRIGTRTKKNTYLFITEKGKAFLRRHGDLVPTGYRS